jgi:hypothetical protein
MVKKKESTGSMQPQCIAGADGVTRPTPLYGGAVSQKKLGPAAPASRSYAPGCGSVTDGERDRMNSSMSMLSNKS